MINRSSLKIHNQIPYSNIECQHLLLSADQIINRWQIDRHNLSKSISTNNLIDPWINNIPIDKECRCNLGVGGKPFIFPKTCNGCVLISRLFPRGEINSEITIKV